MNQTESRNTGADNLQRQDDQQLAHESPPRNWIVRNWKTVASVGGLFIAAGVGVALLDWASRAIEDVAVALNFFAQNTFSLLIFLAVIVQAVISNRQWRAMKDSVERTDTIIGNMQEQLTSMQGQETIMREQVEEMRRQIRASDLQFETQLEFTQIGITTAEKSAIYAQRAYVSAKVRGVGREWPQLRLRIENTGTTPANNVVVAYNCGLREEPPHKEWPDRLVSYDIGWTVTERLGLIAPQSSYHVIETPLVVALDNAQTDQWRAEKLKFYCWGAIYYEDIFNDKRRTMFCFVLSVKHPNGYPCEYGNEAY